MPRIAGVDIPENKRVLISLTYIYGIGKRISQDILKKANIDSSVTVSYTHLTLPTILLV